MRDLSLGSAAGTEEEDSPTPSLLSFGVAEAASDDEVGVGVSCSMVGLEFELCWFLVHVFSDVIQNVDEKSPLGEVSINDGRAEEMTVHEAYSAAPPTTQSDADHGVHRPAAALRHLRVASFAVHQRQHRRSLCAQKQHILSIVIHQKSTRTLQYQNQQQQP